MPVCFSYRNRLLFLAFFCLLYHVTCSYLSSSLILFNYMYISVLLYYHIFHLITSVVNTFLHFYYQSVIIIIPSFALVGLFIIFIISVLGVFSFLYTHIAIESHHTSVIIFLIFRFLALFQVFFGHYLYHYRYHGSILSLVHFLFVMYHFMFFSYSVIFIYFIMVIFYHFIYVVLLHFYGHFFYLSLYFYCG